jgi:hypothetical protein
MSTGSRRLKSLSYAAVVSFALGLLFALTPAQAATGRITLHVGEAGFIIGVSGGQGQLEFAGRTYPLSVGGVSIGLTIGASSQNLSGSVENINSPADIQGTYSQISASAALGPGGKVIQMQNSNGVVLKLQGFEVGFEASVDLGGLTISLK